MLSKYATAPRPLDALIEFALLQRGVTVTAGTVQRYSGLLEAAILADDGDDITGNVWSDFVGAIDGSKFAGVVHAVAETLGASSSDADSFIALAGAVIDVRSGLPLGDAEAALADDLAAIEPTEPLAYAHLDEGSRTVAIELDRAIGAPDPARPEPSHIAEGDEE
jgi:hypothetical protein